MENIKKQLAELFVNKLPPISASAKELFVKFLPWVVMIFGALGLFGWLASLPLFFGAAGIFAHSGAIYPVLFVVHMIIAPISSGLGLYGGYLMLSRQQKGWNLIFYSLMIGFISTILSFSIVGLLVNCIFGYLLFQIQDQYFSSKA